MVANERPGWVTGRVEALQMLVKAVEAEVAAYIETHQHEVDQDGRRLVVRNGHARERTRQRRGSAEDPGAAG